MQAASSFEDMMEFVGPLKNGIFDFIQRLEKFLSPFDRWKILLVSAFVTYYVVHLLNLRSDGIYNGLKSFVFKWYRRLPIIKGIIKKRLEKTYDEMEHSINKTCAGVPYLLELPDKKMSHDQVVSLAKKYRNMGNINWDSGRCSGTVYSGNEDLTKLATEIYGMFAWSNPLHADVFPDVRKMEAEVVRMCCNMFNGSKESCGTMTSGGTESIMLACKVYRDLAYERGIQMPEILCPISAHAAFDKSAEYFKMKIVHIPVDKTGAADVGKMRRKINRNTCMLVGSAPSFPHGIIDPMIEIAKLGKRYNIPVHTDCCLGGFIVPFMDKAGYPILPFDFRVDGITSISADTHKYGYAPKGSSVILYSEKKYLRKQIFSAVDWPGGIYASPTFAGSRAGAIIAACWATMLYMGEKGYVESTKAILDCRVDMEKKLRKIKGIRIIGKPDVTVIAIASDNFNIYRLSDAMAKLGWNLNALQYPSSIHICLTLTHTKPGVVDKFVNDISSSVNEIMKNPNKDLAGLAAMYGTAQSVPDRGLVGEFAASFIEACYNTNSAK